MKRSVRALRANFLFLPALALVMAAAATTANGCELDIFQIIGGLDAVSQKVTAHQAVTFQVRFKSTEARTGSVRIDYGDGSAEDTGLRTFDSALKFNHVYTTPGTFRAYVDGGRVQPCTNRLGLGSGYEVHVIEGSPSSMRSSAKRAPTPTAPTFTQTKSSAAIPPGVKNTGAYQTVGKEKGNPAYAFAPGQIARASVSLTVLGNVLKVEGSGKCGLKVFEELDGKALKTYDFKGPLPTSILMLNTLPGIHVAKIEGDKSSESCGGTATASFPVAKSQGPF